MIMNLSINLGRVRYPHRAAGTRCASFPRRGFTLIEILTVIGIIGVVAAMVVGLAANASVKKKRARVEAEKARLEMLIDGYKDKLGFYPPDNGSNSMASDIDYGPLTAKNQLFYELTGNLFDTNTISSGDVNNFFHRGILANSSDTGNAQNFFKPAPKPTDYKNISGNPASPVFVLTVPVERDSGQDNFWHYDSSSKRRHNADSYDLWAEYRVGNNLETNGNWKN